MFLNFSFSFKIVLMKKDCSYEKIVIMKKDKKVQNLRMAREIGNIVKHNIV